MAGLYEKMLGAVLQSSGEVVIFGANYDDTITLPHTCPEADFRSFIQEWIRDCRPYDRLILSIADTTPPDADFGRIRYLCEQCAG